MINRFKFKLIQADEFTLRFMEGDSGLFPCADIDRICKDLTKMFENQSHDIRKIFRRLDKNKDGRLSYGEFRDFLFGNGFLLNEHEVVTLCRKFDSDGNGEINLVEFARLVHGSDDRGE